MPFTPCPSPQFFKSASSLFIFITYRIKQCIMSGSQIPVIQDPCLVLDPIDL